MPSETLSKQAPAKAAPPPGGNQKLYLLIAVLAILLLAVHGSIKFLSAKKARSEKETFVEDPNRKVFKEADITMGLERFSGKARDSYLRNLEDRAGVRGAHETEKHPTLAPVTILSHEEKKEIPEVKSPMEERKPIGLPLGTRMPALLMNKIFSFNVENHTEAELTKDIYYLGTPKLPKGTKFFGNVSVLHSENRVNIQFYRLLLPSGEERSVRATALSLDGSGGLVGKVHKRWVNRFLSITGKTALGALTLLTVPNRQDAFSLDSQLRLNAASNLSQEAARELNQIKTDKAISVQSHIPIQVVLLESL